MANAINGFAKCEDFHTYTHARAEPHAHTDYCTRTQSACHPFGISLGDIHNVPTLWILALFEIFSKFCFHAQTCHRMGGGMCVTLPPPTYSPPGGYSILDECPSQRGGL